MSSRLGSGPLCIYCGHHRSGSTWIYRVLRELVENELGGRVLHAPGEAELGGHVICIRERSDVDLVCYTNADYDAVRGADVLCVHVVRDPRDLLVSAYYAHAFSHPTSGWSELESFRRILSSCSTGEGMLLELDFCDNVFADMRSWPRDAPGTITLRFEDLIEAPLAGFRAMLGHWGLASSTPRATLERVVEHHSFERLSGGRRPGTVDPLDHYRKGVAGDWRQALGAAQRWAFLRRNGDLLEQYGYEHDSTWAAGIEGPVDGSDTESG
jgi:hypothetical protein